MTSSLSSTRLCVAQDAMQTSLTACRQRAHTARSQLLSLLAALPVQSRMLRAGLSAGLLLLSVQHAIDLIIAVSQAAYCMPNLRPAMLCV